MSDKQFLFLVFVMLVLTSLFGIPQVIYHEGVYWGLW